MFLYRAKWYSRRLPLPGEIKVWEIFKYFHLRQSERPAVNPEETKIDWSFWMPNRWSRTWKWETAGEWTPKVGGLSLEGGYQPDTLMLSYLAMHIFHRSVAIKFCSVQWLPLKMQSRQFPPVCCHYWPTNSFVLFFCLIFFFLVYHSICYNICLILLMLYVCFLWLSHFSLTSCGKNIGLLLEYLPYQHLSKSAVTDLLSRRKNRAREMRYGWGRLDEMSKHGQILHAHTLYTA